MQDASDRAQGPAATAELKRLTFIHDDYAGAAEEARRTGRAVVVDAWAPWCHTCLSMQNFVLPDEALAPLAERAVFVALDTDRPENAAFVEKYAIAVWPSFFVIDAKTERLVGFWPGAASVDEFRGFVSGSVAVMDALHRDDLEENSPLGKLLDANVAQLAHDFRHAAELYRESVRLAPADWPRRSEALLGLVQALRDSGNHAECVKTGQQHIADVAGAARPTDFVRVLHTCAQRLKSEPEKVRIAGLALQRLQALVSKPPPGASIDDQADTLELLAELQSAKRDREGARRTDEERLALLDRAAAAAPHASAASTFDYGRARALVALGHPERALQLLQDRERALPQAYEPPARLAALFHDLGRFDEALAAVDRAIARAYGPRRLRYLALRSRTLEKLGRRDDQIRTLESELSGYEALGSDNYRDAIDDVRRRLDALRKKR